MAILAQLDRTGITSGAFSGGTDPNGDIGVYSVAGTGTKSNVADGSRSDQGCLNFAATVGTNYGRVDVALSGTTFSGRFEWKLVADQGATPSFPWGLYGPANAQLFRVRLDERTTGGRIRLYNGANVQQAITTGGWGSAQTYSFNKWVLVEWHYNATTGAVGMRFTDTATDTLLETLSGTVTAGTVETFRFGCSVLGATAPNTRFDDLLITDDSATWLGPWSAGGGTDVEGSGSSSAYVSASGGGVSESPILARLSLDGLSNGDWTGALGDNDILGPGCSYEVHVSSGSSIAVIDTDAPGSRFPSLEVTKGDDYVEAGILLTCSPVSTYSGRLYFRQVGSTETFAFSVTSPSLIMNSIWGSWGVLFDTYDDLLVLYVPQIDENFYIESVTVTPNQWVRLEWQVVDVYDLEVRIYYGDSSSPIAVWNETIPTFSGDPEDFVPSMFGIGPWLPTNQPKNYRFDDFLLLNTNEAVGPVVEDGSVVGSGITRAYTIASGAGVCDRIGSGISSASCVSSGTGTTLSTVDLPYAPYWAADANLRLDDPTGLRKFDIHRPDGATGPLPTVVWIHGGRFNAGDKGDISKSATAGNSDNGAPRNMLDELLSRGYTVISPNYRKAAAVPAGPGNNVIQHPDFTDDIQLLLSELVQNYSHIVDVKRIILAGHSAGGYLAALTALARTMTSPTTAPSWNQVTNAAMTIDINASSRYTGGPLTVQNPPVLGVAVWEAPVDFRWNSFRESTFGSPSYGVDNAIRGYLGADDYLGAGGRINEARSSHADLAHDDGTSSYVNSSAPPIWYGACRSVDWFNTFLPTLNDGTVFTGGNGFYLQQAYNSAGASFTHYIAVGANHDDVNAYGATEMANWVDHLVGLVSSGLSEARVTSSGAGGLVAGIDGSVTTTAPVAAAITSAPATDWFSDGSVTTVGPVAASLAGTPSISWSNDGAVTTTAPVATASAGTPITTGSNDGSVTTTAPVATALTSSPIVEWFSDGAVTTAAPVADALAGTPTAAGSSDGAATTTAPVAAASVSAPTTDWFSDGAVTVDAPVAVALAAPPTIGLSIDGAVTVSAPIAVASVETPATGWSGHGSVTVTAPVAVALTTAPVTDWFSDRTITITAPVAGAVPGIPTLSGTGIVAASAAVATALVTAPSISVDSGVTTIAPIAKAVAVIASAVTNVSIWDGNDWTEAEMMVWDSQYGWVRADARFYSEEETWLPV